METATCGLLVACLTVSAGRGALGTFSTLRLQLTAGSGCVVVGGQWLTRVELVASMPALLLETTNTVAKNTNPATNAVGIICFFLVPPWFPCSPGVWRLSLI